MASRPALLALLLAASLAWLAPARAEVWGYVDEEGVAHFAAEQLDARYELFFRGNESPTSGDATPRSVAVPTRSASKLIAFFDISPSFKQVKHHLREASREQGIDLELLQALIATESGFDPEAVSPKGAVDLMQIMPATAQRYGVRGDRTTPLAKKMTNSAPMIGQALPRLAAQAWRGVNDTSTAAAARPKVSRWWRWSATPTPASRP